MHPECYEYVRDNLPDINVGDVIVEFGSYDVNGSVRDLFVGVEYIGVDIKDGPSVDVVGDAGDLNLLGRKGPNGMIDRTVDLVLCLEVFEHTPRWREIIRHAEILLRPGGTFIMTAACDPRLPHSAVDGENLAQWAGDISLAEARGVEYYKNINPTELDSLLDAVFWDHAISTLPRGDVRATATVPD